MQRATNELDYINASLWTLKTICLDEGVEWILIDEYRRRLKKSEEVQRHDGEMEVSVRFWEIIDYLTRWNIVYWDEKGDVIYISRRNLKLKLKHRNML